MTILDYTIRFAGLATVLWVFMTVWLLAASAAKYTHRRSSSQRSVNSSLRPSQVYDMCRGPSGQVMCIRHCMWNMTECQNRCVLARQVETLYQTSPFGERSHGRT